MVGKCYVVTHKGAHGVSDPLADFMIDHLPEPVQEVADTVLGPAAIVSGLYELLSECARNEQRIVEEYYSRRVGRNQQPPAPPAGPAEPDLVQGATPSEEVMVDGAASAGAAGD